MKIIKSFAALFAASIMVGFSPSMTAQGESDCDCAPCVAKVSSTIPLPQGEPTDGTEISQLLWQTFVAINWPADLQSGRGQASASGTLSTPGAPRVWETWKQSWELYQPDPSPWSSYEVTVPPCSEVVTATGERVAVTRDNWPDVYQKNGGTVLNFINMIEVGDGPHGMPVVSGNPLIDVDRNYVRYEIRVNQALYDCVSDGTGKGCARIAYGADVPDAYKDLCPAEPEGAERSHTRQWCSMTMPGADSETEGAISVKASWRKMTSDDQSADFYSRDLLVLDYEEVDGKIMSVCRSEKRILVGLHLVYKDSYIYVDPGKGANQDQWLWGTFEQDDNTPPCDHTHKFSFSPAGGYSYEPARIERKPLPPPSERVPVMVCRQYLVPKAASVSCVNRVFKPSLPRPWSQYFLVNNQWLLSGQPSASNYVTNTTIETYVQESSCMTCHQGLATRYDHLWALALFETRNLDLFDHSTTSTSENP